MALPPEVSALLTDAVKAVALPLLGYCAHGVRQLIRRQDGQGERVKRLEVIVTGVDGDNGLRSAVSRVEEVQEDHERRITRLEPRRVS